MKFTYAPDGADPKSWDYKPAKMMNVESEAVEEITGWTFAEFGVQFLKGSTKAYHALLWVLLRRTTPGLKYSEVQFARDEVSVEWDDEERAIMVERLQALPDLDDDQQALLESLLAEMPEAPAPKPAGEDPKD